MSVTSKIQSYGGVPTLFVNGVPQPGLAYMTYLTERADYQNMANLGCRLFSVCTYFAARPVNAAQMCGPFAAGIFDQKGVPDFSTIDTELARVLAACPDCLKE